MNIRQVPRQAEREAAYFTERIFAVGFWDIFDTALRIGSCFNWIGEVGALGGDVEQCDSPAEAKAVIKERRSQGYNARMVYNPASDTYDVITR